MEESAFMKKVAGQLGRRHTLGSRSMSVYAEYVIAADYDALQADRDELLAALARITDRCEAFIESDMDMRVHSVEMIMGIAEDAINKSRSKAK